MVSENNCAHHDQIIITGTDIAVCPACVENDDTWVSLRLCTACGHIGCCDESKNRHAAKHYQEQGHAIVRSVSLWEPVWYWCYIDEVYVDFEAAGEAETAVPDTTTATKIIRNYLTLTGLYTLSASMIWGVNTLFLLDAGLSILEVFITNSIFTAAIALFEIPTGVLADARGRRASFLLSLMVLIIGTLGFIVTANLGGGIVLFSLMVTILGLGFTFYSGAMDAWLVDALKAAHYKGSLDRIFARASIVTGGAMLVGTVSGGFLGSINLVIPYAARAILLALVLVFAFFTMHDLGFTTRGVGFKTLPDEMQKIARASIIFGWRQKQVRLLILSGLFYAAVSAWGFSAWQPYFLDLLGQNLAWVAGLIAAGNALATMAGNSLVEYFTRFCGKRTTLLLYAAGAITIFWMGVGLTDNFYLAVIFYLLAMFAVGVMQPVTQAYIHYLTPSAQRATVISFNSLVGSTGSISGQIGLGFLAQMRSIGSGYVAGGLATVLALPPLIVLRRMNEQEDKIIGRITTHSSCAAQGLPDISGLNVTQSTVIAERK